MAQPQTVKVVEVVRVVPAPDYLPGSATSPVSLPLTFFDLLWLRFPPVERLFFYQVSDSPNTSLYGSIVPKLKHSLSLALHHFLPLCGNLTWPQDSSKPVIKYVDGDGVSLIIAESTMDFNHLSGNDHFRDVLECRPLVPILEASHEKAPVMALQVTVFPNSGFSIGITTHHAVVDGKSSTSFLKSWAQICKTESASLGPELTPFYDRTVIKDPTGLGSLYANEWLKNDGPGNRSLKPSVWPIPAGAVRATFEHSREDIEKLRASICAAETEQSNRRRISTFAIICGYAWVCREKARQASDKTAALVFSVDCRSRLKPSIHPMYFGNCITGCFVAAETEELLGENGLSAAVKAINEAIRKLDDGVLNGAERWISMTSSHAPTRCTGFGSSPRFEVYNIDFGWGRPRKVELTSIDRTEAISIDQSSNGNGGVELGMVLNPQEMESFAASFAEGLQAL